MNQTVQPGSRTGTVSIPASKSQAHRLLICAALGQTPVTIRCLGISKDIAATIGCLNALGTEIAVSGDLITAKPIEAVPEGLCHLPCGESGSTLRFLLPVAGALGASVAFHMEGRLPQRPLHPLDAVLTAHGMTIRQENDLLYSSGQLCPGEFFLPGNVSSQYISGLLMALPLLDSGSALTVTGELESAAYVTMTEDALRRGGVSLRKAGSTWHICGRQRCQFPAQLSAEGDWSNAAFWLCAGAIGSDPITVEGVSLSSAQGDRNVLAALSRFGARIVRSTNAATVQSDKLAGFEMSAHDIPDLVPVISAVASLAQGRTFIRDCARLRIKESDRLVTTTRELTALGAQVRIAGDDLIIKGVDAFTGGEVDSHNDHRIAMMAAIAASRATGEVVIHGAEAVNKSYPDFFDHYRLLGGKVTLEEE